MRHLLLPLLMLKPNFVRVPIWNEERLGLTGCWRRLGRVLEPAKRIVLSWLSLAQVPGWWFVGEAVWFLEWKCFFMVWVRQAVDFWIRWCMLIEGVVPKLIPKQNTSISVLMVGERKIIAQLYYSSFPSVIGGSDVLSFWNF